MSECCRAEDIVCRWAGDEFVILLPKTDRDTAQAVCERISEACEQDSGKLVSPSIALGSATKSAPKQHIEAVMQVAENRMYRHKLLESTSARSAQMSSLERALSEKSYVTQEHAQRLRELSLKLGRAWRLTESQLDELSLVSSLHDIGKIAIPDSIIMKPDGLTEAEKGIMMKHPEIGYRIAQSSPDLSSLAEGILSHHEKWDGTGYPSGLKGKQINIFSRILAIVDAYDAMTNPRPYRRQVSHEEALKEILRCSGSQFDPELVELFLKIMR